MCRGCSKTANTCLKSAWDGGEMNSNQQWTGNQTHSCFRFADFSVDRVWVGLSCFVLKLSTNFLGRDHNFLAIMMWTSIRETRAGVCVRGVVQFYWHVLTQSSRFISRTGWDITKCHDKFFKECVGRAVDRFRSIFINHSRRKSRWFVFIDF